MVPVESLNQSLLLFFIRLSAQLTELCNRASLHLHIKINTHDENPEEESTCGDIAPLNFHSLQRFGTKGLKTSSVVFFFVFFVLCLG